MPKKILKNERVIRPIAHVTRIHSRYLTLVLLARKVWETNKLDRDNASSLFARHSNGTIRGEIRQVFASL